MPDGHLHSLRSPGAVLLEASAPEGGRSLLFSRPERVLAAHAVGEVPALLEEVDRLAARGFWLAGFLHYECGYAFERIAPLPPSERPVAWFGAYRAPRPLSPEETAALFDALPPDEEDEHLRLSEPVLRPGAAAYAACIARIREHIRAGDVYQINYTGRFRFDFRGDPLRLYRRLRTQQPVPYGAYLDVDGAQILSCSPELFFRREGDRITARPMKGTAPRGRTNEEDEAVRARLAADEKSRAENLMIVDLLRNDLSVVCEPGSVRVPALFTTERYRTLIQMTSTVEGRLRPGVTGAALFRALFPCGSVTGAPKIRAMQLIHRLEPERRGVYTGAIGYVAPGGDAVFSVAIRTVELLGGRGEMGSGSGIVWDSDAEAEYEETRLKAAFLTRPEPDFSLVETMRWEDGCPLLDEHLARLLDSAAYFDIPLDPAALRARLADETAPLPAGAPHRVRLLLDRAGRVTIRSTPLEPADARVQRLAISARRTDSRDPFRFHKTTRRELYEDERRRAAACGFDEVLFLNERGEVTEGSRTNVFARFGDRWYTPPRAAGLLAGVYRGRLMRALPARERPLRPEDLRRADELFVCNAVRGRLPARLAEPPGAVDALAGND